MHRGTVLREIEEKHDLLFMHHDLKNYVLIPGRISHLHNLAQPRSPSTLLQL